MKGPYYRCTSGGGKIKPCTITVSQLYSIDSSTTNQGQIVLPNLGWTKANLKTGTGQGKVTINGSQIVTGIEKDISSAKTITAAAIGAGFNGSRLSFTIELS